MRKDLHKVITERERSKSPGRVPSSKTYTKDFVGKGWEDEEDRLDQLPRTESMRERLQGNGKNFTDVLGPLKGVLRKACGRKWDDVWAEFHEIFPPVNVQYQHIYEHINQYVCVDTYLVDKKVCYRQQLSSYRYQVTEEEFVPLEDQSMDLISTNIQLMEFSKKLNAKVEKENVGNAKPKTNKDTKILSTDISKKNTI